MPHRIEVGDGLLRILISGEVTAAESREHFRAVADFLHRGPACILLAYGQGCKYLTTPRDTLRQHLAVAETIRDSEGGALALQCREDSIFGICRQFQIVASESRVRVSVFREVPEAEEWLACVRREGNFPRLGSGEHGPAPNGWIYVAPRPGALSPERGFPP